MIVQCARCDSPIAGDDRYCPQCGAERQPNCATDVPTAPVSPDTPPSAVGGGYLAPLREGPASWGIGPVALGVMALVPSAILVSMIALVLPLPITTVIAAGLLAMVQVVLVWVLTTRTWPLTPWFFGLVRPRTRWWRTLISGGVTLGASLGFAQLYVLSINSLGLEFLLPPDLSEELLLPGVFAALSVIALAVVTPIAEEVFFRGFVLRGLVNRTGIVMGVILSAAVFAGLHFQPGIIIPVFVTGLLLGRLYWQTGSIWPGIGVHAAQNLIATIGLLLGL